MLVEEQLLDTIFFYLIVMEAGVKLEVGPLVFFKVVLVSDEECEMHQSAFTTGDHTNSFD